MIQESAQRLLQRVQNEVTHTNLPSPSIYMVPRVIRDLSPSSFSPRLVSIGPLHRDDENVQAFERHKASYLVKLMSRINSPPKEILKSCMQQAYTSMNKIKACYVWTKDYSDAEIAEMMVMDACFMLEFVTEYHISVSDRKKLQLNSVIHDFRLLENQIPWFFVDEIFHHTVSKFAPDLSLLELLGPLIICNLFETYPEAKHVSIESTDHILSILHQRYKPPDNIKGVHISRNSKIHHAVHLDRVGVNIKPNKDPTWIMGMEVKQDRYSWLFGFRSKPTLTMPVLKVHDSTEYLLRNLIAYEQTFETQYYFTSYAFAMDMLVNTHEDVAKLIESKVIHNIMGSNEEAANMINNICKNAFCDFFYVEEWEKLSKYCDSYWPKHIANMRSTYFSSPWNTIALVAGIILFVLQVVQTIYTIKSSGSNK